MTHPAGDLGAALRAQPDAVAGKDSTRVLRSPADGIIQLSASIGDLLAEGQTIALVEGHAVTAPFTGLLRGLISDQVRVQKGLKIGDIDPRTDPAICSLISEKALAVGGGVMEAILSTVELRKQLWS
jgi:xanthine dehydrogenase accessory factor